jgi:phosphatidylserine decarboxylase
VNEQSEIWVDHDGRTAVYRQVVGLLARRVVARVKEGDTLVVGQRVGVMKFGSRMDVFLPPGIPVAVKKGDRVVAAETILGRWTPA